VSETRAGCYFAGRPSCWKKSIINYREFNGECPWQIDRLYVACNNNRQAARISVTNAATYTTYATFYLNLVLFSLSSNRRILKIGWDCDEVTAVCLVAPISGKRYTCNILHWHFNSGILWIVWQSGEKLTISVSAALLVKVGFHYPSSRAEFTGRVDGPRTRVHFLTPVNSGRELG